MALASKPRLCTKRSIMTIEAFNTTHILTIVLMPILIFIAISIVATKWDDKTKRFVLLLICYFNAALYLVYKIVQVTDPSFEFRLFYHLPLHFCNINLILLPLAIHTGSKNLMAYQLYFGPPLAGLALITIYPAFLSRPLFEFLTFTYFFYHSMLFVLPFLLVRFKLFAPSFKNIWQPVLILVGLTFFMHMVNIVFRATGLAAGANYFFTFGLDGDFFTEMLKRLVPYNFFFLLPSFVLFAPYVFFVTLPFHLSAARKKK